MTACVGTNPSGLLTSYSLTTPNFLGVDYTPGTTNFSNGYQDFHLYLPDPNVYSKPASGWPVVLFIQNTDWLTSTKTDTLTTIRARALVEAGIAAAIMTTTVVDTGDPNITNGGMFWAPSDAGWATDDIPHKDVGWAIQKLRDDAALFEIDPAAIGLFGQGHAAATLALWVAQSEDLADSGAGTTQEQKSTLPDAVFSQAPTAWYGAYDLTTANTILRSAATPTTPAATLANATANHRRRASPLFLAAADPETAGRPLPHFINVTSAATSTDVRIDSVTGPLLAGVLTAYGDGWNALVMVRWLRDTVSPLFHRLHSRITTVAPADVTQVDRVILESANAFAPHIVAFFRATLGGLGNVETFDVKWEWAFRVESRRNAVTTQAPTAHRRQTLTSTSPSRVTASVQTWEIGSDMASKADSTRLQAIWASTRGKSGRFDFPIPDAPGTIEARFVEDSLSIRHMRADRYRWRARIEEWH